MLVSGDVVNVFLTDAGVAMYGVGLGHVPWTMSDLFSLEVRGLGTGIGTSTNWVCLTLAAQQTQLTMT